jgi:hypothetical protein
MRFLRLVLTALATSWVTTAQDVRETRPGAAQTAASSPTQHTYSSLSAAGDRHRQDGQHPVPNGGGRAVNRKRQLTIPPAKGTGPPPPPPPPPPPGGVAAGGNPAVTISSLSAALVTAQASARAFSTQALQFQQSVIQVQSASAQAVLAAQRSASSAVARASNAIDEAILSASESASLAIESASSAIDLASSSVFSALALASTASISAENAVASLNGQQVSYPLTLNMPTSCTVWARRMRVRI